MKKITLVYRLLVLTSVFFLQGCTGTNQSTLKPNDVIPIFQHWNLILGDGSNVGPAINYENKDFFYKE